MPSKKKRGSTNPKQQGWLAEGWRIVRSGLFGAAIEFMLILLIALAAYKSVISIEAAQFMLLAASALSGLAAGMKERRGRTKRGVLNSFGAGGAVLLTIVSLCVFISGEIPETWRVSFIAAACLCGGGLAGVLPSARNRRRR